MAIVAPLGGLSYSNYQKASIFKNQAANYFVDSFYTVLVDRYSLSIIESVLYITGSVTKNMQSVIDTEVSSLDLVLANLDVFEFVKTINKYLNCTVYFDEKIKRISVSSPALLVEIWHNDRATETKFVANINCEKYK